MFLSLYSSTNLQVLTYLSECDMILALSHPFWQQKGGEQRDVCYIFPDFRHGGCSQLLYLQMVRRKQPRQLTKKNPPEKVPPGGSLCEQLDITSFLAINIIAHDLVYVNPCFLFHYLYTKKGTKIFICLLTKLDTSGKMKLYKI